MTSRYVYDRHDELDDEGVMPERDEPRSQDATPKKGPRPDAGDPGKGGLRLDLGGRGG